MALCLKSCGIRGSQEFTGLRSKARSNIGVDTVAANTAAQVTPRHVEREMIKWRDLWKHQEKNCLQSSGRL